MNALDGKLFASDWLSEQTTSVKGKLIDAWYSGKAHEDGGNIQALSAPDGFPLWVSAVEPGSTHDLTAARAHVLAALYWRPPSWIWRLWPMSAMRGPGSAAAAASLPVALEDEFTFGLEPILTGLGSIHRG